MRATYETPYSYVGGIAGCSVGTLSLCENTCDIQATPSVIAYAEATAYLGGVVGIANLSTISNCINSGIITLTPTLDANTGITVYAGGISGRSNSNTTGCDNTGSVIIEEFKASSTSSVSIDAKFYVAGIIGYSTGTITGSNNAGLIRARGVYAYSGGIAGYNTGTLSQCSNIGNIMTITTSTGSAAYSYGYSGGIVGYSTGTTSESYNTGFVEVNEAGASEAAYSGGIVSYQNGGTIINCYNAGYVPDKTYYGDTGGIAGYSTGSISVCYNTGRVPEGGGAIVGYTSQITPNCFFLDDNKVGVAEGKDTTISCSKEALLLAETYTGFDFNSVWEIGIYDTYPCATLKNVEHKSSMIGNELFAGGTGTAYDPFLIENAEQLNNVRVIPSAYYELIADITFKDSDYAEGGAFYNDGEGWLPIMYFVGSFDGCGHVISNLQIHHAPTSSGQSYDPTSTVHSYERYARYYSDCFGLFGFNCGGTISRVGVTGNIYVKKFDIPYYYDYAYVGGIAGKSNGTISECYFIGSVYGTAQYSSNVGGICGWSWDSEGTLKNCFSQGTFTGPSTTVVGGITGSGSYSNCYSIGRVVKNGASTNIAIVRGSGSVINCTEDEMRTPSTYVDFDFDSIWTMEGNPDYPYPELKNVNILVLGNNEKQFKINSAYLVLSQDINVIYRATIPEGFTNPRMVFEFNGEQLTVTDYSVDENGRYCYSFPKVNPQKMGDNISATLYATVDGAEVNVSVPNYSVRQYCVNQLNKNPDSNLKRMISDLLVYGEKTQIYQNYKTDALVTSGLSLTPSTFDELDSSYNKQQITGTADTNVRYSSASLELSNDMIVLLGITTNDPTPYTFEVTINGKTEIFTSDDLEYRSGKYYLSFSGVKATAFDDVITAVIKKDGVQISQTLNYSVYTYIQKNQNTDSQVLCDLLKAIYNYGESAKLYEQ